MPEQKTKPTGESVEQYLNQIENEQKRLDCFALLELMRQATQLEPVLWASSMVGFGQYHYKYASGHEGDSFLIGFAPRKQNIALYGLLAGEKELLLAQLGKHKTGKGCVYINQLADIQIPVLRELVEKSFAQALENRSASS